jgi:hypothetical protein
VVTPQVVLVPLAVAAVPVPLAVVPVPVVVPVVLVEVTTEEDINALHRRFTVS